MPWNSIQGQLSLPLVGETILWNTDRKGVRVSVYRIISAKSRFESPSAGLPTASVSNALSQSSLKNLYRTVDTPPTFPTRKCS